MRWTILAACVTAWMTTATLTATPPATAAEPDRPWAFDPAALTPFWRSDRMIDESVLFVREGDARPTASLLLAPTKILAVRSASGKIVYEEGRDYVLRPGTRELELPPGSRIVCKTPQSLRRPPKSQPYALTHRDGGDEILFGGGHEYHDMQTVVAYEHRRDAWRGPTPSFAGRQLPGTIAKLRDRKPVAIALLGDSISTGCNASGWAKTAPFQPPYQDLLVMNLEAAYGGKVVLKNFAVGGMNATWGLGQIGRVTAASPDLVILAFGMNDVHGRTVAEYRRDMQGMIDAVRKANPTTEVILIATMLGNPDWAPLRMERFAEYRDALSQLCGPGVALADMTSVWTEMGRWKKDRDLTGNGVNHPNDFGHRVYAQVLSALLIEARVGH